MVELHSVSISVKGITMFDMRSQRVSYNQSWNIKVCHVLNQ